MNKEILGLGNRIYEGRVNLAELTEDSPVIFRLDEEGPVIDSVYIGKSTRTWASFIHRKRIHYFSYLNRRRSGEIGLFDFRILTDDGKEFIDFSEFNDRISASAKLGDKDNERMYWAYHKILRRHGK